jgi:hypothetical protein
VKKIVALLFITVAVAASVPAGATHYVKCATSTDCL